MIFIKRAYDRVEKNDGQRFLVDHLWPRGVKKDGLHLTRWLRGVSPSNDLREWFAHDPAKWEEFQSRYFAELDAKPQSWETLVAAAEKGDLTLVFAARDEEHNNAVALRTYLITRLKQKARERRSKRATLARR